jgi:hypothetical protein
MLDDRIVPSGSSVISGVVYQDLTGNGLSSDDTPLGSVKVSLYLDSNHDGKFDNGDKLVVTQQSGSQGTYSFGSLAAGTYFVSESTPSGYIQTAPTPTSYLKISLGSNQSVGSNNFDNYKEPNTGVITDISFTITDPTLGTYIVTNLRGNTHQNDIVTANFTVTGNSPALVSLVTYDAPGATFDANTASQQVIVDESSQLLSPGPHSLTVHLPDNFYQVDFVAGAPINQLGPAGGNIFYSAENRLLSADNEGTQAFSPGTVSGVVYNDVNQTGVYNSSTDAGLAGVTVTVTGTNDLGEAVTATAVTNASGEYSFPDLREGTYTITQTTPAQTGFVDETSQETFALGGTATPGQIAGIAVTNGAVGGNYNLPEVQQGQATISGVAYFDSNGNGMYSTSDVGLGLVTVTLTGTTNQGAAVSISVQTSANGSYSFAGVLPGTYTLTFSAPPGYGTEATQDALPPGATATAGQISNLVITSGTTLALNLPESQGLAD